MKISNMIHAVDLHACGEPGRVIVGGVLDVPGESMFDKMQYLSQNADSLRLRMLREPRGYPAANCNLILPSNNPEAVAGFVIMEQTEYPGMSGTNTICVVTTLIETGMVDITEPFTEFKLDTPAGLISISAEVKDGKAVNVTFENVPAFSVYKNKSISVPEIGEVTVDIAYGGMFYVILDSEELGLELSPGNGGEIVRVAEMVKAIAAEKFQVVHPLNKDISGITIAVVSGPPENPDATLKNAVVVSTGKLDWDKPETWKGVIDRSPCGTGTCAKMASLYAKDLLDLDTDFIHEGILGTTFTGRLVRKTMVGNFDAVVPTISGRAWITGFAQYVVDENDPFPEGFTIGDIWGGN
ncbi:MAG: proline racemase family protein [Candidatus Marinimicrobia bacterium]|nr:proline racemase family protein [Candidatus Neomarinimicrobiota bacterium]